MALNWVIEYFPAGPWASQAFNIDAIGLLPRSAILVSPQIRSSRASSAVPLSVENELQFSTRRVGVPVRRQFAVWDALQYLIVGCLDLKDGCDDLTGARAEVSGRIGVPRTRCSANNFATPAVIEIWRYSDQRVSDRGVREMATVSVPGESILILEEAGVQHMGDVENAVSRSARSARNGSALLVSTLSYARVRSSTERWTLNQCNGP